MNPLREPTSQYAGISQRCAKLDQSYTCTASQSHAITLGHHHIPTVAICWTASCIGSCTGMKVGELERVV